MIGAWLLSVTDQTRCYLAAEEQIVISSILRAFPEEFAVHLEGRCSVEPRDRSPSRSSSSSPTASPPTTSATPPSSPTGPTPSRAVHAPHLGGRFPVLAIGREPHEGQRSDRRLPGAGRRPAPGGQRVHGLRGAVLRPPQRLRLVLRHGVQGRATSPPRARSRPSRSWRSPPGRAGARSWPASSTATARACGAT